MSSIQFYKPHCIQDDLLAFAVIAARHNGAWVWCKHKERDTLEFPGGHREAGETIDDAAKRELFEETGAAIYTLETVCVYAYVPSDGSAASYGMLYFAEITAFDALPACEIASISFFTTMPTRLTYPHIQPYLLERVTTHLNGGAVL